MTSLINYRRTGRISIATWAWYKFGEAVLEGKPVKATAFGAAAVEATVGIFFPDPVATALGGLIIRGGGGVWNLLMRTFTWAYRSPFKSSGLVYIALMPFAIKERQELKAERGLIEPIGAMTFEAEAIPETERLGIPSIPTSRVF